MMTSAMSTTALSAVSGGILEVFNTYRPSIADCSSAKFTNGASWKSSNQWRNAALSRFVIGTEHMQIRKGSNVSSERNVRRGWTTKEGAPVVAMEQIRSIGEGLSAGESPAGVLRRILASPGVHQGPACFDALSARLVEQAGFGYAFMSGFAVSAVRLGAPDVGLISYGEVLEQGRLITSSVTIPVIGDGDNGYGNALNVKRTVKGFIQAGFAGILIEDQVSPKSCGHFGGKSVVSREEALTRIKAAVDARSEARGDIVIIARSDARQAESLEEALWRAEHFAQLGADVLFIDALTSKDEMLAFCKVAPSTPKMTIVMVKQANMLEGGGRTPILSPMELGELGFKLVAYPLSLVGVSMRAMQSCKISTEQRGRLYNPSILGVVAKVSPHLLDALKALKSGRLPPPGTLPSFSEIKDAVGIQEYYEEDERYASLQTPTSLAGQKGSPDITADSEGSQILPDRQSVAGEGSLPILEGPILSDIPDVQGIPGSPEETVVLKPDILGYEDDTSVPQGSLSNVWSRTLRVKVTGSNGGVKLDVRIPAGFLDGLSSSIPGVAGFDVKKLLDDAVSEMKGNLGSGQQLVDFTDRRGERIQVFLE